MLKSWCGVNILGKVIDSAYRIGVAYVVNKKKKKFQECYSAIYNFSSQNHGL